MSREVLPGRLPRQRGPQAPPAATPPRPAAGSGPLAIAEALDGAKTLDGAETRDAGARPRAWRWRLAAALAVGGLVGALGGTGYARQAARHEQDDATRVSLWADPAQAPGQSETAEVVRLRVTLAVSGTPVIVEGIRFGGGSAASDAGPTLLPGHPATAELLLHPDCRAVAAGRVDLTGLRAVVRPADASSSREVPLDVLPDLSALSVALLTGCAADVAPAAATPAPDSGPAVPPAPSPALTVSGLAAEPSGRLTFTLASRGTAAVRFDLPVAQVPGSPARITLRARPGLPVTVRPGHPVRVVLDVRAACRPGGAALPETYGLLLPDARIGTARRPATASGVVPAAPGDVPLEGWDDGTAAAAVTAAVLLGCPA